MHLKVHRRHQLCHAGLRRSRMFSLALLRLPARKQLPLHSRHQQFLAVGNGHQLLSPCVARMVSSWLFDHRARKFFSKLLQATSWLQLFSRRQWSKGEWRRMPPSDQNAMAARQKLWHSHRLSMVNSSHCYRQDPYHKVELQQHHQRLGSLQAYRAQLVGQHQRVSRRKPRTNLLLQPELPGRRPRITAVTPAVRCQRLHRRHGLQPLTVSEPLAKSCGMQRQWTLEAGHVQHHSNHAMKMR
mmetsp:Transcript_31159/g.71132  ORF Transcript_31159/g.71132 Transcript_31159/m.71132 type:complete len:242 (+) Transcript_31159:212-937(+)